MGASIVQLLLIIFIKFSFVAAQNNDCKFITIILLPSFLIQVPFFNDSYALFLHHNSKIIEIGDYNAPSVWKTNLYGLHSVCFVPN